MGWLSDNYTTSYTFHAKLTNQIFILHTSLMRSKLVRYLYYIHISRTINTFNKAEGFLVYLASACTSNSRTIHTYVNTMRENMNIDIYMLA